MRAGAALVVASLLGLATGCAQDTEKKKYLDSFFAEDNEVICASVVTQGGVQMAAAGAIATINNERPELGLTQPDVAEYLGNRCRGGG